MCFYDPQQIGTCIGLEWDGTRYKEEPEYRYVIYDTEYKREETVYNENVPTTQDHRVAVGLVQVPHSVFRVTASWPITSFCRPNMTDKKRTNT